ncbi:TRAP transporter substrate-binding protein [Neoroseomonas lacus]|uniref:C4-dicarboxylate ABC transporter n=1 Tax=Neoroseomonas lacus TaxID=287609 RepID=A0A917KPY8_9PROT|nr:TRAP transporter substrate-binding protein [Neoroseomonas lacus]GGJ21224.1 C4-dicarboxylate ABC transporter [Neoroseomonas lacus]
MNRRQLLAGAAAGASALALPWAARAQQAITLNGAVQFNDDHVFTRALVRFEELVKQYYTAAPVNFILHKNSSLGLEKQYFEYMSAGRGAVDYGIVSPAHMSTFSRAAPFVDAPFLFTGLPQWNMVLDQDLFAPVATEIERRARVALIGYAGGGVRNIFANKRITDMAGLRGLKVRVQGAPIWSRTFQAAGMSPSVIAYNEVYNGIQNNVIEAGENEAAGVEAMRFYEVAPNLIMTQHAITIRPICFSSQTLARLPAPLQEAVRRAGKEAGTFGRQAESTEDGQKIAELERVGRLRQIEFTERAELKRAVDPVMVAYAREVDAETIFNRINAITV